MLFFIFPLVFSILFFVKKNGDNGGWKETKKKRSWYERGEKVQEG